MLGSNFHVLRRLTGILIVSKRGEDLSIKLCFIQRKPSPGIGGILVCPIFIEFMRTLMIRSNHNQPNEFTGNFLQGDKSTAQYQSIAFL